MTRLPGYDLMPGLKEANKHFRDMSLLYPILFEKKLGLHRLFLQVEFGMAKSMSASEVFSSDSNRHYYGKCVIKIM